MKMVLILASSVFVLLLIVPFCFTKEESGIYQVGEMYDAEAVSFSRSCRMSEFSVEKKIIYERRANSSGKRCAERAGSVLMIKPKSIFMRRSAFDGSYVVVLIFDQTSSIRIEKIFGAGRHDVLLYRGDTLLTFLSSYSGRFRGKVEAYFDHRKDADEAMNQVASIANQNADQTWH